ncbi:MAG: fasciclin domain-containing protein [Azonexus sp.]
MKKTASALVLAFALSSSAFAADIVDTAVSAGSFNTLVTAVKAAGLVETLKGPGPFTVFAPTDEAFAKIPKAQLDALLADKKKLTAVLTYHVVAGKVMAKDVKAGPVKTVEGASAMIKTDGGPQIDNARIVKTDVAASNGVIHVIDTVIMPPAPKMSAAESYSSPICGLPLHTPG